MGEHLKPTATCLKSGEQSFCSKKNLWNKENKRASIGEYQLPQSVMEIEVVTTGDLMEVDSFTVELPGQ